MQYLSLIFSILLLIATYALHQERSQNEAVGHIAFISDRTGESRIHIMSADGTLIKKIDAFVYMISRRPAVRWFGDAEDLVLSAKMKQHSKPQFLTT